MRASDAPRLHDAQRVSPWAFFLPVALAVMVGTLAADLVRLAIARAAVVQAQREIAAEFGRMTKDMERATSEAATSARPVPLPIYPAPSSSMPVGSQACSGGVVLTRIENGWEQSSRRGNRQACQSTSR